MGSDGGLAGNVMVLQRGGGTTLLPLRPAKDFSEKLCVSLALAQNVFPGNTLTFAWHESGSNESRRRLD